MCWLRFQPTDSKIFETTVIGGNGNAVGHPVQHAVVSVCVSAYKYIVQHKYSCVYVCMYVSRCLWRRIHVGISGFSPHKNKSHSLFVTIYGIKYTCAQVGKLFAKMPILKTIQKPEKTASRALFPFRVYVAHRNIIICMRIYVCVRARYTNTLAAGKRGFT